MISGFPFRDLSIFQENAMTQAGYYYIPKSGELVKLDSLAAALASDLKTGYIWLDFIQPVRGDLEALIEPLGLHPLSVEDCFDDNQIPKLEDYPKNTFILFNTFQYIQKTLDVEEVDFFIGVNFVVTVSREQILPSAGRIADHDIENVRLGPAFLAHVLLDWVVDRKFVAIDDLEEELNAAEDVILADHAHFNPGELVRLRREMLALRKSLFHEREILMRICRKDCPFIPEPAIVFYRDIYDHLTKFFELTESSRDLVTSLMEMYLSMVNNQMTRAANETNATVRRLTFITTIFMPLTLLAGIGGMSEWSMMTGPENWRIAYPLFLLAMVALGVANYFFLVRFERRRQQRQERATLTDL
jgi:magnesium transporter